MADILGGFQPDTKSASSRRADYELLRRHNANARLVADTNSDLAALEARVAALEALAARVAGLEARTLATAVALTYAPPNGIAARVGEIEARIVAARTALTP